MALNEHDHIAFRDNLNKISPSFCIAKWLQVTLHLHSGHNHSCHHPNTHQTPLGELVGNPSALHNTKFKKEQRHMMKVGERPAECDYCWNVEDLGPHVLSDRTFKAIDDWAKPYISTVKDMPVSANVNPTYAEVSFSNACNFRCSYCSGNFSSRWNDDIKKFGNYSTYSGMQTMKSYAEEENPYIDAFWEWWPNLSKDLRVFRITGGEPLLSKNTFRVLEELSKNPNPELEIGINSNLGISDANFQKFLHFAKDLTENKKVRLLRLYTSVEAWGEKAEYIRNGLEFPRFQRNLETFLHEVPLAKVGIMATYNALSVTSYTRLMQYVYDLKFHKNAIPGHRLSIDTSYLRHPFYQTIQVLPATYQDQVEDSLRYMKANAVPPNTDEGFRFDEIMKLERTLEWMRAPVDPQELKKKRRDFYRFFTEHDQRRNTNFLQNFPEMTDFWNTCRDL